jgi:mannosyltransferase OCH1-like enzyme
MFNYKKKPLVDPAILERAKQKLRNIEIFKRKNKPYQMKPHIEVVIPLNLYVTWHTKQLPRFMDKNYRLLQNTNPEFNHVLYDDSECRQFISKHFDNDVVTAFDTLIPGAYKADLWRCCILYINGGIYIDIKFKCVNNFKFMEITDKEYLVRDRHNFGIYNALMVSKPGNPILRNAIDQVVRNTQTNFYGENALHPTGPYLFKQFIDKQTIDQLELYYDDLNDTITFIVFGETIVLVHYPEYRTEQKLFQKTLTYTELWNSRNIYKV